MKVRINKSRNIVVVKRGNSPRIYSESGLLHQIKKALLSQGHDVIKKLMWKDGHLVDDKQHYIREQHGEWCIYDPNWAIRFTYEDYNDEKRDLILAWESLAGYGITLIQ